MQGNGPNIFNVIILENILKTIKSNENNAVSLSQQIQNERSERLNPVENFNDELKRRLAGRSNFPSSNSDDLEKSNQATKNNSQSDSNPGFWLFLEKLNFFAKF